MCSETSILGVKTKFDYDLITIGAGSAGYPAGMYASRYSIKNLIIGGLPGGALGTSHKVENYPGVLSAPGKEIMDNFRDHAIASGSEILTEMVTEIKKHEDHFHIKTSGKKEFKTKKVLLATGNNYRKLGAKGEKEYLGKGVSYCATCDGMFFRNRDIVMVGGGNTAVTEALYLADICNKVYLVHRNSTFRAENIWIDKAKANPKIEFVLEEEVEEITGDALGMTGVTLKSGKTLKADGIFVAVGTLPNVDLVSEFDLKKDDEGCLVVDARQETSLEGLYAAGDVTTNSNKFRQTIMSAAEGCLAANSIHEDLMKG
ncbi:MAG: FAD-dependent oxidoreductase [Candidatus Gracilibacteria bacterium]|nr:FAD-dependent oxidoreductase [Candidatus Gracilibacteria bacterium]MDQ7022868.1 FAD-dependent oxidoreductase [Candidatus Gracilibacteria bacterium]